MDFSEFRQFLVDVINQEFTPRQSNIPPRWQGGKLVLHPGNDSQPKEIPLEVFFKKIIGVRESLRVLEQKINNHDTLSQEEKLSLSSYITKCYGSMTSFNILFSDEKDRFVGAGGRDGKDEDPGMQGLSLNEVRRRIGIKEYGKE